MEVGVESGEICELGASDPIVVFGTVAAPGDEEAISAPAPLMVQDFLYEVFFCSILGLHDL